MTERAEKLHAAADQQITALINLVSTLDQPAMRRPCPGREKLGDGTVAASAQHTADNYQRIAAFIQDNDRITRPHMRVPPPRHGTPRCVKALGHRRPDHAAADLGVRSHDESYTADNVDLPRLVERLSASRRAMQRIGELTDSQLDSILPAGSFRFCDGQRTLEQVLTSLLTHQAHQLGALGAATA